MLKNISRGFTLVELIVSLGLFAFVMSISTGAYLIVIASSREAQATATGINNLSYVVDSMTRNMRTGANYSCGGISPPNPSTTFSFNLNGDPSTPLYYRRHDNGTVQTIQQSTDNTNFYDLTDSTVKIDVLEFFCNGLTKTDDIQANVVIVIKGVVSAGPSKNRPFNIQTSATRRGVDL